LTWPDWLRGAECRLDPRAGGFWDVGKSVTVTRRAWRCVDGKEATAVLRLTKVKTASRFIRMDEQ